MNMQQYPKNEQNLKRSILVQTSSTSHINPMSTRPSLSRRSYGQEQSASNLGHVRFQSNHNMSTSHLSQSKNDSYISLGQKKQRQASKQLNSNANIEKKLHEINTKIQRIFSSVERHDKQLVILQRKEENGQKSEVIKQLIHQIIGQRDKHYTLQNKLFKADLDTLKFELKTFVQRKQFEKKFNGLQKSLKDNIWEMKSIVNQQFGQIQKKQGQARKRDYDTLTKEIQSQMKHLKNYIHQIEMKNIGDSQKDKQGKFNSISKYTQNNFINSSFLNVKVESKMYVLNGQRERQVEKSQVVYLVDNDGYLLDSDNRYIIDHSNRQIKLSPQQIQILKQNKIMC